MQCSYKKIFGVENISCRNLMHNNVLQDNFISQYVLNATIHIFLFSGKFGVKIKTITISQRKCINVYVFEGLVTLLK